MKSTTLFISALASLAVRASAWSLQKETVGQGFLNDFKFETLDDPTHGRVNYVDKETAQSRNLTYVAGNQFIMRADDLNTVDSDSRGRDSVRLYSYESYQNAVLVLDIEHMPQGCGTWPAFWTLSTSGPWPRGGEIDIIEQVNNAEENLSSIHAEGCQITATGRSTEFECDPSINGPGGCGVPFTGGNNYGAGFNANRGGWYAMKKAGDGISVWFWPRGSNVPSDVRSGSRDVNPDAWGTPDTRFTGDCDFNNAFDNHAILFDLTFCGDWAGAVYESSGCPSTCEDYVDNNPEAFRDAYWTINSLRAYV